MVARVAVGERQVDEVEDAGGVDDERRNCSDPAALSMVSRSLDGDRGRHCRKAVRPVNDVLTWSRTSGRCCRELDESAPLPAAQSAWAPVVLAWRGLGQRALAVHRDLGVGGGDVDRRRRDGQADSHQADEQHETMSISTFPSFFGGSVVPFAPGPGLRSTGSYFDEWAQSQGRASAAGCPDRSLRVR